MEQREERGGLGKKNCCLSQRANREERGRGGRKKPSARLDGEASLVAKTLAPSSLVWLKNPNSEEFLIEKLSLTSAGLCVFHPGGQFPLPRVGIKHRPAGEPTGPCSGYHQHPEHPMRAQQISTAVALCRLYKGDLVWAWVWASSSSCWVQNMTLEERFQLFFPPLISCPGVESCACPDPGGTAKQPACSSWDTTGLWGAIPYTLLNP